MMSLLSSEFFMEALSYFVGKVLATCVFAILLIVLIGCVLKYKLEDIRAKKEIRVKEIEYDIALLQRRDDL